jgi:hypothetical protein
MRKIRLEKEYGEESVFNISTTRNGYQWLTIFTGTMDECKWIMKAFIDIGYLEEETSHAN